MEHWLKSWADGINLICSRSLHNWYPFFHMRKDRSYIFVPSKHFSKSLFLSPLFCQTGASRQNVVALHCLDGRSHTAVLFATVLLITKVFSSAKEGLKLFEIKRAEPILSCGQRAVLGHLEQVLRGGPNVSIPVQAVSINSVILEPVPLFTKANDGVSFCEMTFMKK